MPKESKSTAKTTPRDDIADLMIRGPFMSPKLRRIGSLELLDRDGNRVPKTQAEADALLAILNTATPPAPERRPER